MANSQADLILHHIRELATNPSERLVSDGELLRRFTGQGDEGAFATLVQRHGLMVLRVSQRILHHTHDAEDVFQATFMVLARKASAVSWHDSVANWLYEVTTAYRGRPKPQPPVDSGTRALRRGRAPDSRQKSPYRKRSPR